MNIQLPVHCNVSVSRHGGEVTGFLRTANPPDVPPKSKTWKHPGYSVDPRHVIACMARERKLVNRGTLSAVTKDACDTTLSLVSHVADIASKLKLSAYRVAPGVIDVELNERGPVVASLPVTPSLLKHVSDRLKGGTDVFVPSGPVLGHVAVVITGWEHTNWIVALPWGHFPGSTWGDAAWDGCVQIPRGYEVDPCALIKRTSIVTSTSDGHSFPVKLLMSGSESIESVPPPPPTRRADPPPPITSPISKWLGDDRTMAVVESVVALTVVVVAVLCIIMLINKK